MKRLVYLFSIVMILVTYFPVNISGKIDVKDTKLLSQPAISKNNIAFVYAGDLWIAGINGENARRLTSDEGIESNPVFSPDGKLIAFNAEYDGNVDVYIVPAEGGVPKRLTWHPGSDNVRGFTPEGSAVLFISPRYVFTGRYNQLFTVPVKGGFPEPLKIPNAYKASYSPDGSRIAYIPFYESFLQWKHYRGGTVATIWICDLKDYAIEKIPQPDSRCNDTDPMWIEDKIYFRSDRNGEFNLFYFDINSKKIEQITHYTHFPILDVSAGEDKIIYEQAGHLHIINLRDKQSRKLKIGAAADLQEVRPRYVKGDRYIRSASISPTGARAVFNFRGEIVTVPAEKGDPRNLTNTTGIHERFPAWSPDGKLIAYLSDESGEYELHIRQQDGKGKVRKFKLDGSGFYAAPVWSPDSEKILYTDNSQSLYWINLETGLTNKIASEYMIFPGAFGNIRGVWSPDSKWIAYTLNTAAYIQKVHIYSLEENKSYAVTDGLSEVSDPVFDKSGKYIYFFASTDAGPIKQWFAQSKIDMRMTRSIYLATLRKDIPSPVAKESDEEKGIKDKKKPEKEEDSEEVFSIEFDGLNYRIVSLPVSAANFFNLQTGEDGNIYYLEAPPTGGGPYAKGTKLHRYDLNKRKDDVIMPDVNRYLISADKKKILYYSKNSWGIAPLSDKIKTEKGKLKTDAIEVLINPRAEWNQMFHEAWRINRDYFYAANMHGADWEAMRDKYSVFLPHLACRRDLNRVIQWMCSELSVGHHYVRGGDSFQRAKRVSGGLLGADYSIENGRYRFKKVYGGLNWNPRLRSPLKEPGVDVNEGEYLLSVNGKGLFAGMNLFSLFENTSGKIIEITVGPNPDFTGTRTLSVVPIGNESTLRNRDWIESNIKKVDEATDGRAAYVYVPNTAGTGQSYFKRYFFPQVHKEAIILDERFNGGGSVADYYIDILKRQFVSNWHMRYGADIKTPGGSIQGPKVMIIDETAGSGGDLLPWMFRKFKLGKLVGKRTWGGLVGILGFPNLMDGGAVSAPNLAIWTEDGWVVENVGVPPDIEVEQRPADVIAGRDPQLEKAIEVIMEELKKSPPKKLKRPPYPVRVKNK
ncbi:PDZ domain-containing protein [candidate division KSB1 bacterium]